MNLYDIVTPMTVDEAKATSQRLDAKCWKGKHKEGTKIKGGVRVNNCVPNEGIAEAQTDYQKRRQRERDIDAGKPVPKQRQSSMTDYQKRRAEQKRQEQLGENAWNDGTNDWTSEHDQWTKENINQDPINALTGVDEAISYESNKAYAEVGPHKRYTVYVGKKKFNDKFGFIAVAVNPRTNDAKFKANGATQQEAVEKLKSEVDKEIDVATKVSGSATIDFNVDFVRDVLEMSSNTFYAKIVPGPKLVIAGKEMEQYPDIMKQEGFKTSSIRTVGDSEGATKLPAMPLSATGATTAQLVANGRYALGAETIDKDGNRIFDLEFDSVVADPRERIRMGAPAITIGTKRETAESSNDPVAIDSTSPVGGNVQEGRLQVGDPVIVTAPNAYEGKTGEIAEFSPSGKFVIVNLYNHGRHSMHLSDVEYNQYADEEDEYEELDELDVNTLKSYADKRGAQVAAMKANNPNPQTGSKEWVQQAVPAQQVGLANRKIARKERQAGVAEVYTPSPAKPFRNPPGFNKQGTGVGNKLAQQTRDELAKKKPQGVAEVKQRLDANCWKNKHIGKPATKIKGGVRVNNCVPNESVQESYWTKLQNERNTKLNSLVDELKESVNK